MKKTCLIALLIFCVADIFAQECTERKNKLGFNLYFSEFDLNSFEKKFGIKYWFLNKMALRSTLGFSKDHVTDEYYDEIINENSIDFSFYLEYHFYEHKKISPYFGFGVDFGSSSSSDKLTRQPQNIEIIHKDFRKISYNIPFGIECHPFRFFSLAMQYSVYFKIEKLKNKLDYKYSDNEGVTSWNNTTKGFAFNKFCLILTIYF